MGDKQTPTELALYLLDRLQNEDHLTVSDFLKDPKVTRGRDAIQRALNTLKKNVPGVERTSERSPKWSYHDKKSRPCDASGLTVLALTRAMLTFTKGTALADALDSLYLQELAKTPEEDRPLPDVSRLFYAKSRMVNPLGVNSNLVDQVCLAVAEQRKISMKYTQFNGKCCDVVVEPYSVILGDEGLYVYGRCCESDDEKHIDTVRLYNVKRMENAEVLKLVYVYPSHDDYDPDEEFGSCFGIFRADHPQDHVQNIELHFVSDWVHYLQSHKWHPSQQYVGRTDDGWCRVTFHVQLTRDLVRWIRSMGPEVRVSSPARLLNLLNEY